MQKRAYPDTPEQNAARSMLGGPVPDTPSHLGGQFERVNEMFGSNDPSKIASSHSAPGTTPWPSGGKTKKGPAYDPQAVREALTAPRSERNMGEFDPRQLHASQPGLTRGGVEYYMGDDYSKTGTTYAGTIGAAGDNAGNAQPVVYSSETTGRNILLSGHHRAGAALLKGEPLNALRVKGK